MELVGRCPAEIRDFQSEISNPQSAIYFDASASLTKSTAGPRIARVCFVSLAGSKLTRTGPGCQAGAGHAESGSASSGRFPARVFCSAGLRRLSCATTAEIFLAVVGTRRNTRHSPGTSWRRNRCCQTPPAHAQGNPSQTEPALFRTGTRQRPLVQRMLRYPVAAPPQTPYLKYYSGAIRNHEFLPPLA
jgi:hypothetical protein